MRSALTFVLAALLVLSAVGSIPTGAAAASTSQTTDRSTNDVADGAATAAQAEDACEAFASDPPANPDSDRLGWENGCWANESIAVNASDGLNTTEFDAIIGRSMARVETVRELEFQRTVPVELLSQEVYRQEILNFSTNVSTADRLHQNTKWEAAFIINESNDAIEGQRSLFANGTSGFYDPATNRIRIVSSDPANATVPELTLGHELVHALQDQHFNTTFNRTTTDGNHAASGITEGDADYVEALYSQRCASEWSCLSPASQGGGGGSVNVGLQVNGLVPYSEGSAFVRSRHQSGGWDAVNQVYENPPRSAEQVIHAEAYPGEAPVTVSIDHSPSGDWRVLELPNSIDHATFGEGAIYTMIWYASYEKSAASGSFQNVAIPYEHLFTYQLGTSPPPIFPYNYSHPLTDGWAGDRLVPYVTDESAETGETGYVWKLVWDTPEDAEQFRGAYVDVLEYRGAEPVEGRENTYRIPEEREFSDAFYVTVEGDTVTIVNGPTVEDLAQIREGAAPEGGTATTTESPTDDTGTTATTEPGTEPATEPGTGPGTETATETDASGTPAPDETEADGTTTGDGPGFGWLVALAALLGLGLALAGRHRVDQ